MVRSGESPPPAYIAASKAEIAERQMKALEAKSGVSDRRRQGILVDTDSLSTEIFNGIIQQKSPQDKTPIQDAFGN